MHAKISTALKTNSIADISEISDAVPNTEISLPILNISRLSTRHVMNAATIRFMIKRVLYVFAISLLFNLVSNSPDCGNDLILSLVFLHLASETSDMYHDCIVGFIDLLIPYLFKDLIG